MSRFDPQPPLESGSGVIASDALTKVEEQPMATFDVRADDPDEWLRLAREAYNSSTSWLQTNLYRQLEKNQHNFRSIHPPGSKYHTATYKFRSKMFRPMIRTAVRKLEAAVSTALFNNPDLIDVQPQVKDDPMQAAAAMINKELLQERLRETIPWFKLCVGAVQDAAINGIVVSYQDWKFQTTGEKILFDEPRCELVPAENLRIDRAADWLDPINSSPFLIQLIPMYVGDVIAKMERMDQKTGQPEWKPVSKEELRTATREDHDALRSARETPQQDPQSAQRSPPIQEFDLVWIHRNFLRIDGNDYIYYTAGTTFLLSEPMLVNEVYPHLRYGERPYVCGSVALESHRVYPDSYVHLGQNLQGIANDVANRRHDNVLLSMDKRFFIKRGANMDRDALVRSTPGGGIETDDPINDVRVVDTGDVTGSAYAEQDRVNQDFDQLLGVFNPATRQANRAVRDTQKGMELAASDFDGLSDYLVRTLLVTWVTPVISQLVRLEQMYETDMMLLAVAADRAQLYQKFGVDEITDELLRQQLTIDVNVGIGATSPMRRINVLHSGISAVAELPGVAERINADEIVKETFSALGFGNGARFVMPGDQTPPQVAALQQQLQELQQIIEQKQIESETKKEVERIRQTGFVEQWRTKGTYDMALEAMKQRIDQLNMLIKAEEVDVKRAELELERDALVHQMMADSLNIKLQSAKDARDAAKDIVKEGGAAEPFRSPPVTPSATLGTREGNTGEAAGTRERDDYGLLTESAQ